MNYTITKMTGEDVSSVYALEKDLIGTSSISRIWETINSNTVSYYVMKNNDEAIGFVEFSIISPECELYTIGIKKEYQGQKLSHHLMDKLFEICRQKSCETIFLEVNSINKTAINLYNKYGFKSYSLRKNYYGNNDAILMKLDL